MDPFISSLSEDETKKERIKAREIRKSQWWKRRLAAGRCYYCDKKFRPDELTMDHLVPVVRGGRSRKGNLVTACKKCNDKKKHMLSVEWEEYIEKLKSSED